MPSQPSGGGGGGVPKSPFFRPREKPDFDPQATPGGSRHLRKRPKSEIEQKSTILGCSANLINAIVGSGIVGLPYAIKQAGLVAGIFLVILCALLTDKSLRLLIETAKHVHVPSYETVAEVAFGKFGFLFVALSMFIMAYGAMLSYLMIIKDTFSSVLGIDPDNYPMKRAILFLISITIIVPLSSQRDMASLAKTSRINVTVDFIMVILVLYCAPISENITNYDWSSSIIHYDTIFVGIGVLSFAFVCQHSGFIIAGSLHKPTKDRWASCTRNALSFCVVLALMCGTGGYLGYQENVQGNILNSLDDSLPANIARGLLGTTMLFVYPMESFVARHVCVVLFFKGRSAHEGDDTSVLNRKDRRITLTLLLYLIAVIPAGIFQNLGTVLAACGAVGGSCLSYIGPGMVYLGIHGARFLELSKSFFGDTSHTDQPLKFCGRGAIIDNDDDIDNEDGNSSGTANETFSDEEESALLYNNKIESEPAHIENENCIITQIKNILWYIWLMPIWCKIASIGKHTLTNHVSELALKSPHPIRIGNVRFASTKIKGGSTRVIMLHNPSSSTTQDSKRPSVPIETTLIRRDSLPGDYATSGGGGGGGISPSRMVDGNIVALPLTPNQRRLLPPTKMASLPLKQQDEEQEEGRVLVGGAATTGGGTTTTTTTTDYQSINSQVGRMAKRKKQEEQLALEDDPQQVPPGVWDFLVAIFFIVFGVVAMVAGLFSIVQE